MRNQEVFNQMVEKWFKTKDEKIFAEHVYPAIFNFSGSILAERNRGNIDPYVHTDLITKSWEKLNKKTYDKSVCGMTAGQYIFNIVKWEYLSMKSFDHKILWNAKRDELSEEQWKNIPDESTELDDLHKMDEAKAILDKFDQWLTLDQWLTEYKKEHYGKAKRVLSMIKNKEIKKCYPVGFEGGNFSKYHAKTVVRKLKHLFFLFNKQTDIY